MARSAKDRLADIAIPVLLSAAAAGDQKSPQAEQMRELLAEVLAEELAERKKSKLKGERLAKERIAAAQEEQQIRLSEQAACSHRKKNNEPRTAGQMLSNGQLCIVCLWCGKDWFTPPNKALGQTACPPDLMPDGDMIGG